MNNCVAGVVMRRVAKNDVAALDRRQRALTSDNDDELRAFLIASELRRKLRAAHRRLAAQKCAIGAYAAAANLLAMFVLLLWFFFCFCVIELIVIDCCCFFVVVRMRRLRVCFDNWADQCQPFVATNATPPIFHKPKLWYITMICCCCCCESNMFPFFFM
jgi:hypothetical protein